MAVRMSDRPQAVLFDLLMAVMDSIGAWSEAAGERHLGLAWREAIPYKILFPAIIVFASLGTFSLGFSAWDVFAIAFFGILGYVLTKLGCEPAPLLLGFVLGPIITAFRSGSSGFWHTDGVVAVI